LFTSTVGYCGRQDKVVSFLCALDDDDRSTLSTNATEKDEFLGLVSDTHYTQGGHKTSTKSQAIRWVRNAPTVSHDNVAIDKFGGIFISDFVTNLLPTFTVKEFRQEFSSCRDGRPCQSRVGRKSGGLLYVFSWGSWVPHLTQYRLGRSLPPYQVASWSIQPFGHNTRTLQTVIGVAIDSFLCYPVALVTIVKTA